MVSVTLIRHGQATHNIVWDGAKNTKLTNEGLHQVAQIKGEYNLVICSPLLRTKQTLSMSKIRYTRVFISNLCRELMSGHPANYFEYEDIIVETNEMFRDRVKKFIEYVKEYGKNHKRIAVVSHHDFIHALSGYSLHNACQVTIDL